MKYAVAGVLFSVLLLVFLETASLTTWVTNAFYYETPFLSSSRWLFASIDSDLFGILSFLTPLLFITFFYSWLWLPLGKFIRSRITLPKVVTSQEHGQGNFLRGYLSSRLTVAGLLTVVAIAAFVASYPGITVETSRLVGIDADFYRKWLIETNQNGVLFAFQRDRPFSDLALFSLQLASGMSPELIVRIMPIVCAVALSLVVFWFVRLGLKNNFLSLISSLFSVFAFQTVVGVFVASIANWLAIIEVFLMFGLFLKSIENRSLVYWLAASVVGIFVLLTHPYTWFLAMAVLGGFGAWGLLSKFMGRKSDLEAATFGLFAALGLNLVFYLCYSLMPFGSAIGGAGPGVVNWVGGLGISLSNLNLYLGFSNMVQNWVGGLFGNPVILLLSVFGIISLAKSGKLFGKLMVIWVMVPSLILPLGSPETFFYYRVVYFVPFQVLAAVGFYWLLIKLDVLAGLASNRLCKTLTVMIAILVVLLLFNYSLRSVAGTPIGVSWLI